MESLRKPFFVAALLLIAVAVLVEIGALAVLRAPGGAPDITPGDLQVVEKLVPAARGRLQPAFSSAGNLSADEKPPGRGIPYLALLDALLLFTVALMGMSLLVRERIQARVQGVATLVVSVLVILGGIGMILAAIAALILMVSLLLAVPFGTLAYLAVYGSFNRSGASAALGLLMVLKIAFAACLLLSQERFLQNKGLVALILTSLAGNVVISFLQGLVPGFLVSITDDVAAIVVAILAVLWAIFLLIGSLGSIVKALRFDRV